MVNKLPSFPSSNDSGPAICPSKSFLAFCSSLLMAYTPVNRGPPSGLDKQQVLISSQLLYDKVRMCIIQV